MQRHKFELDEKTKPGLWVDFAQTGTVLHIVNSHFHKAENLIRLLCLVKIAHLILIAYKENA
jgi:hypothetical protein